MQEFDLQLLPATLVDHPTIQNLARFYVYDLSRYCGFISNEWACPPDGLYADSDLKKYFQDANRKAYLVKIDGELAGFVLLHHVDTENIAYWVMAEFFIVAKFQSHGIGTQVAEKIWNLHSGKWEVPAIPENKKALSFWRKAISNFTKGNYKEEIKQVDYDQHQPNRYIFSFDTNEIKSGDSNKCTLKIEIQEINGDLAEKICRNITSDLPEYFGIPEANKKYFEGVHSCKNFAAKLGDQYLGLLALNFPYANNGNIYWMAVLRNYQAQGVGKRLLNAACQFAKKSHVRSMTVETLAPSVNQHRKGTTSPAH